MLQATSPLTTSKDIQTAFKTFQDNKADSLVTVVRAHRFLWKVGRNGEAIPKNYKPERRPLRQEWDGEMMENGAFYFFTAESFRRTGSRLSGKIVAHEMSADTFVEVDERQDLIIVEKLLNARLNRDTKSKDVQIAKSCTVIGEIGINHNGDMDICKKLIMACKVSGAKYAKLQKRNPDVCIPEGQKSKVRDTPWGKITYIEYKRRIEFSEKQIEELIRFGDTIGIKVFASVWDKDSVDLMAKYTRISKIPSALITDLDLCRYARKKFDFLIISTGMSQESDIDACYLACKPDVIMHTNSTYPCPYEDLNLRYIQHLQTKFPSAIIGYSGHEYGLSTTFAAVAIGAQWIERHLTCDQHMWGSDQLSSIEIPDFFKLVKGCNAVVKATQYPPGDRRVFPREMSKMKSLRKGKKNKDENKLST
ncbi:hypothetical protein AAMO2058_001269500 [Amorphochlora amoebiformis]